MDNKKDCKIVQDLLPNYIDKLTSEDTNRYIEQHLKKCNECKKLLEDMKRDIKLKDESMQKEEVNYMKKFKNKMRGLKSIIILFVIFIIIISGLIIGRKFAIVLEISNKAQANKDTDNIHIVEYYYYEGNITKMEQLKLADRIKYSYTMETPEGIITETTYTNETEKGFGGHTYLEIDNKKYACLNSGVNRDFITENLLYSTNWGELLKYSINTTIESTTFRGKECYYLTNIPAYVGGRYERLYIDKETGLMVGSSKIDTSINSAMPIESVYEYNIVTESDFKEPEIEDYKIVDNLEGLLEREQ